MAHQGALHTGPAAGHAPTSSHLPWESDDQFESIIHLEGATYKVKDHRTGRTMVRKTIQTHNENPKALIRLYRELLVVSFDSHVNIGRFYGSYGSPSNPRELHLLTEFCEGGSLAAIGKRISDRGGITGEKVAGRVAEGVSTVTIAVYRMVLIWS